MDRIPKINLMLDPVINFKMKQNIRFLGAQLAVGIDYLSDLAHWRLHYSVEDTIVGGRFSLRGSELGWAKSWLWNLGMTEENTAKLKLRMGLNLNTLKLYARLRFRTEPISPFDIGEGISCAGKLPMPGVILLSLCFFTYCTLNKRYTGSSYREEFAFEIRISLKNQYTETRW